MQRIVLTIGSLILAFGLAGLGTRSVPAQEATPETAVIEGVDIQDLGEVVPDAADQQLLGLTRVSFRPDAALPEHSQPGTVLIHVQAGTVGLTVTEGDVRGGVHVFRGVRGAGTSATPGGEALVEPDTEFTLTAGDSVALDEDVRRTIRNAGDERAVIFVSSLLAEHEPTFNFAAAVLGAMATPESDPDATAAAGTVEIDAAAVGIDDFTFQPATLEIEVGTTVTWTNVDTTAHTATSDDGTFDSGRLEPGEHFRMTFTEPGTFAYHCEIHPNMQGTLIVR